MIIAMLVLTMLTQNNYDVYSVEYDGNIYTYSAHYNSELEIGSETDNNFIVTLDGEVIFVRDIVGGNSI